MTTVTTSVTTVSMDDENQSGLLSSSDRSIIRKTWDQAKRDGDVAPKVLFRYESFFLFIFSATRKYKVT